MNVLTQKSIDCSAEGQQRKATTLWREATWIAVAVVAFWIGYSTAALAWCISLYLFAMVQLCGASSSRKAFYAGFITGMLIATTQLGFFWKKFSGGAVALWAIYAFWLGLFVSVGRACLAGFPRNFGLWLLPVLWCGMEYFRSELYYFRFAWLSPGYAFAFDVPHSPVAAFGVYGTGFLLMVICCAGSWLWKYSRTAAVVALLAGSGGLWVAAPLWRAAPTAKQQLHVAGIQLEFASEKEVLVWLNELARKHPQADLLVLSEYSLPGPPSEAIQAWCRTHNRYIIIGGKEPLGVTNFFNTAFVLSPEGKIVFRQVKCVPIQFFKDGLPAPEQRVWDSPWGKIGICICYDLSYARVTDRLVSARAQALIVPTMDVEDWGKMMHELHARVAPIRAAEYGLPVFRLASSGISQAVDPSGRILASAPFPGEAAMISSTLLLGNSGRLPLDRWLAPLSTGLAAVLLLICFTRARRTHPTPAPG